MNILGVGPGEIILILIVLLVVVGPERLPEFARQAGRMLVRLRNWVQHSPDAALVMRARQEIEQELAQIRTSLLEVQSVRNEVLDAARQLNESVSPLTKVRLDDLLKTTAPAENASNGPTLPATSDADAAATGPTVDESGTTSAPEAPTPEVHRERPADYVSADARPALAAIEELNLRLQAVMADLWALQEQLKQHGVLADDWQPPSCAMQLPTQAAVPLDPQPEEVS